MPVEASSPKSQETVPGVFDIQREKAQLLKSLAEAWPRSTPLRAKIFERLCEHDLDTALRFGFQQTDSSDYSFLRYILFSSPAIHKKHEITLERIKQAYKKLYGVPLPEEETSLTIAPSEEVEAVTRQIDEFYQKVVRIPRAHRLRAQSLYERLLASDRPIPENQTEPINKKNEALSAAYSAFKDIRLASEQIIYGGYVEQKMWEAFLEVDDQIQRACLEHNGVINHIDTPVPRLSRKKVLVPVLRTFLAQVYQLRDDQVDHLLFDDKPVGKVKAFLDQHGIRYRETEFKPWTKTAKAELAPIKIQHAINLLEEQLKEEYDRPEELTIEYEADGTPHLFREWKGTEKLALNRFKQRQYPIWNREETSIGPVKHEWIKSINTDDGRTFFLARRTNPPQTNQDQKAVDHWYYLIDSDTGQEVMDGLHTQGDILSAGFFQGPDGPTIGMVRQASGKTWRTELELRTHKIKSRQLDKGESVEFMHGYCFSVNKVPLVGDQYVLRVLQRNEPHKPTPKGSVEGEPGDKPYFLPNGQLIWVEDPAQTGSSRSTIRVTVGPSAETPYPSTWHIKRLHGEPCLIRGELVFPVCDEATQEWSLVGPSIDIPLPSKKFLHVKQALEINGEVYVLALRADSQTWGLFTTDGIEVCKEPGLTFGGFTDPSTVQAEAFEILRGRVFINRKNFHASGTRATYVSHCAMLSDLRSDQTSRKEIPQDKIRETHDGNLFFALLKGLKQPAPLSNAESYLNTIRDNANLTADNQERLAQQWPILSRILKEPAILLEHKPAVPDPPYTVEQIRALTVRLFEGKLPPAESPKATPPKAFWSQTLDRLGEQAAGVWNKLGGGVGDVDQASQIYRETWDGAGADKQGLRERKRHPKEVLRVRKPIAEPFFVEDLGGEISAETNTHHRLPFAPTSLPNGEPTETNTIEIRLAKDTQGRVAIKLPFHARLIPERVHGVEAKGREVVLKAVQMKDGTYVIDLPPAHRFISLIYSFETTMLPQIPGEVDQKTYERFRASLERQFGDVLTKLIPGLPGECQAFINGVKNQPPLERLKAIQAFVQRTGIYHLPEQEEEQALKGKSVAERLYALKIRLDNLRQTHPPAELAGKLYAGSCVDSALLCAVMLRASGLCAGVAGGFLSNSSIVFNTDAHAASYVAWPNKSGQAEVFLVDATAEATGEVRGLVPNRSTIAFETLEKKRAETQELTTPTPDGIQAITRMINNQSPEATKAMINGNLETLLNTLLNQAVKAEHVAAIQDVCNYLLYAPLKIDPSHPEKLSDQPFPPQLERSFTERAKALHEVKLAQGMQLIQICEQFAQRFAQRHRVSQEKALTALQSAFDAWQFSLVPLEYHAATATITYLKAKKMLR